MFKKTSFRCLTGIFSFSTHKRPEMSAEDKIANFYDLLESRIFHLNDTLPTDHPDRFFLIADDTNPKICRAALYYGTEGCAASPANARALIEFSLDPYALTHGVVFRQAENEKRVFETKGAFFEAFHDFVMTHIPEDVGLGRTDLEEDDDGPAYVFGPPESLCG